MTPSSALIIATDGECLTCGGFSLGGTFHPGSFEFIADYIGGRSLSPRRNNLGVAFMDSTRSGSASLLRAMIEDSIEEFHMGSSGEGGSGLHSPRRHDTRALPALVVTTLCMENATVT
jgi:hypothetical protein